MLIQLHMSVLFMILNRCLTHSYSGIDSLTKPIAQIIYGVAYHRHIDFAHIIWTNLIKITTKNTKYTKYIPYIRFLSIILDHFLTTNPEIPSLSHDMPVLLSSMKYTQDQTGSTIAQPARIPQELLILADRNDKSVLRYRELVARMEPEQPQASAPRAPSQPSEGSRKKGSKCKTHEGKRIEGDLGKRTAKASSPQHTTDHQQDPHSIAPIHQPTDPSVPALTSPVSQDPYNSSPPDRLQSVEGYKRKKSHQRKRVSETVAEEAQPSNVPAFAERPFNETAFEPASDWELQGGTEGVVENLTVSEMSGREIGHKEKVSPPQTTPKSRATTSTTETHALRQGIEEVAGRPPVHAQTHPSHSVSQQRAIVSSVHGDLPRNLPASHSETQGIELRDTPPQSRTSTHARLSSTPRTPLIESASLRGSVHLRDVAGTSVGATVSTVLQGSLGNPTSANITPTLSVGHFI